MSMVDDIKRGGQTTLAIGSGILALLPAALPLMAQGARPLLHGVIKGGLVCLEKGQEAVTEVRAVLENATAENRARAYTSSVKRAPSHAPSEPAPPVSRPLMADNGEPSPEVMG